MEPEKNSCPKNNRGPKNWHCHIRYYATFPGRGRSWKFRPGVLLSLCGPCCSTHLGGLPIGDWWRSPEKKYFASWLVGSGKLIHAAMLRGWVNQHESTVNTNRYCCWLEILHQFEVGTLSIFFFKVLYIQSVVQDFFQQYDWYVDLKYKWHNMSNLEVQFKLQWFDQELPAKFCAVECCSQIHMFFFATSLTWFNDRGSLKRHGFLVTLYCTYNYICTLGTVLYNYL